MNSNGFTDSFHTETATLGNPAFESVAFTRFPENSPIETTAGSVDSQVIADAQGTRLAEPGHPAVEPAPAKPKRHWVRWIVIGLIVAALIGAVIHWGLPMITEALNTVSSDDAFVSGHITNVSPRVEGLVTEVLVDENDRVEAGSLLVRIDRRPFEVALAQSQASLESSRASLAQTRATVKSQLATVRSIYFRLKNVRDQIRSQVATLKSNVADLRARQASEHLAELDYNRLSNLVAKGSATQSELDQRRSTLDNAREQVKSSWAKINQTRAGLGLGPDEVAPEKVPENLETTEPNILSSQSDVATGLARLGLDFSTRNLSPEATLQQILKMDNASDLDTAFDSLVDKVPDTLVAIAKVKESEQQVENDKLRLSWTEIRSEIAGYVQDRQVHPGNHVQPGQTLISMRPSYVWITANYKETQLKDMQIGMPVDIDVDAYPGKVFAGRVAGFSPGTGLSESLLPPENATGNYVKVTQRLPVRIELTEPNPDDTPLFVGLSVVPHVKVKQRPTGVGAGQRLHTFGRLRPIDVGGGPAGSQLENRDTIPRKERP